jgi:hypothetical protein
MNPEDKFLNPRPVPHPKLPRLNTSPTLPSSLPFSSISPSASASPWSAKRFPPSRDTSPPSSATSLKLFRLPRKASFVGKSRSTSPGRDRVTGIRATFRSFRSPRSVSPESDIGRGRPVQANRGAEISQPILVHRPMEERLSRPGTREGRLPASRSRSPRPLAELEARSAQRANLARRRGLDQPSDIEQPYPNSSFQQHRRHHSLSRDPSSLRRSMSLSDDEQLREAILDLSIRRNDVLETVKEANSNLNTPQWPLTAIKLPRNDGMVHSAGPEHDAKPSEQNTDDTPWDTLCLEKRLPTLPNTPSSAYPPSLDNSPSKGLLQLSKMQEDVFMSHFSNSTVSDQSTTDSIQVVERSHFSAWTTSTLAESPDSLHLSCFPSKFEEEVLTATAVMVQDLPPREQILDPRIHEEAPMGFLAHTDSLPLTSNSTIASSASTSPMSEQFEEIFTRKFSDDTATTLDKTHSRYEQTYQLPLDEPHSTIPSKPMFQDFVNTVNNARGPGRHEMHHVEPDHTTSPLLPHSESMQQLIDELSYLRTLIES